MNGAIHEVRRIARVADFLCTGHAYCRDVFARRAIILELIVMASGAFVAAFGLANALGQPEPASSRRLGDFVVGIAGVLVFCLSLLPVFVRWKERAVQHRQGVEAYSRATIAARRVLARNAAGESVPITDIENVLDLYATATLVAIPIPESWFLRVKAHHTEKVFVSRYLDRHPGAVPSIVALRNRVKQTFAKLGDP